MFVAIVFLIISTALFMFYLQAHCQKILRRPFDHKFSRAVANANRLGFPFVRKALEDLGVPVDYLPVCMRLMSDFLALTYLLRVASNQRWWCFSCEQRLLAMYFHATFVALVTAHWLGLNERAAVLKLTSILEYFSNVLGERRASKMEIDVMVEDNGTVFLVYPLSDAARQWFEMNTSGDTLTLGDIQFVEPRHLCASLEAMLDDGLWVTWSAGSSIPRDIRRTARERALSGERFPTGKSPLAPR